MLAHAAPGRLLAWDLAQNLYIHPTRPVHHSENGLPYRNQQAEHGSGDEHAAGGHQGTDTVVPAHLHVAANGGQVQEPPHGVDHDGAEDRLWQDGQCRRDEDDRDDRDGRGRETADLRRAARPIHGGGLGQASGHPQAAEQARADIGAASSDELLVGVQPIATLSGIQSSGTQPLGKTDDRDGGPGEGDLDQPCRRHDRDRGCGQPLAPNRRRPRPEQRGRASTMPRAQGRERPAHGTRGNRRDPMNSTASALTPTAAVSGRSGRY